MEAYGVATAEEIDIDTLAESDSSGSHNLKTTAPVAAAHHSVCVFTSVGGFRV